MPSALLENSLWPEVNADQIGYFPPGLCRSIIMIFKSPNLEVHKKPKEATFNPFFVAKTKSFLTSEKKKTNFP